jgi:hypothetical protein
MARGARDAALRFLGVSRATSERQRQLGLERLEQITRRVAREGSSASRSPRSLPSELIPRSVAPPEVPCGSAAGGREKIDAMPDLTREQFVDALAEVSHRTYNRQALEDEKKTEAELSPDVTRHDRERAEDTVRELERLGVWPAGD